MSEGEGKGMKHGRLPGGALAGCGAEEGLHGVRSNAVVTERKEEAEEES